MEPDAGAQWDATYRRSAAPWDIGRPQPAFERLADEGQVRAPVLDVGCGTGEQALMVASRGLEAVGIDIAPTAIAAARAKAERRGLSVEFRVGDVLDLAALEREFATALDSGVFHTFSDGQRPLYVASLASALQSGGTLHLLCFSELTPGDYGPRRVTQAELRDAFAEGWTVERIDAARFEVNDDFPQDRPHAWLARIVRG